MNHILSFVRWEWKVFRENKIHQRSKLVSISSFSTKTNFESMTSQSFLSKGNIIREVFDLLCYLVTFWCSWRRRLTISPIEHRVVVFPECRITQWTSWNNYLQMCFIDFFVFDIIVTRHFLTHSCRLWHYFRPRQNHLCNRISFVFFKQNLF